MVEVNIETLLLNKIVAKINCSLNLRKETKMHSQEPIPRGRMERIKELEILLEKTTIPEQKKQANAKLARLKLENRLEWERVNALPIN